MSRAMRRPVPLVGRTGRDEGESLRIGDAVFSERDLLAAATSAAERIRGARRLAVWAEPTAETVLAVLGCLIAGATVVPVPPDSGPTEVRHIVADSGAQAWLGAAPAYQGERELPVIPVRALKNKGTEAFTTKQREVANSLDTDGIAMAEAQLQIEHYWAGALRRAVIDGDVEHGSVMAGQSVGLVTREQPAAEIIVELASEAERALARN